MGLSAIMFFLFAILPVGNFEGWFNFGRALASKQPVLWTIFTVIESIVWTTGLGVQGFLTYKMYNYITKGEGSRQIARKREGIKEKTEEVKKDIKSTIITGALKSVLKF